MRRTVVALPVALLIVVLAGCTPPDAEREYTFYAFGTLVHLSLYNTPPALAERAREYTADRLHFYHNAWHAWKPSPLTALNRALAAGRSVVPDPVLEPLLKPARRYARLSGQLFNPAIGKLIELWGFHSDTLPTGPPPAPEAIAALVAQHPSMQDLVWENGAVHSTNPAVQLDFGAFAKGVAVERITDALAGMGVENAILNAGGDLKVLGTHGERPWRIAVRAPDGHGVYASIEARPGEAIFTSGNYERYYIWHGTRYHHLIDPRTGYPARGARSVTVIARSGGLADAAATALFIAGPEGWPAVAGRMGIEFVLLVDSEGTAHMTPAMAQRITFETGPRPPVVIQTPGP